MISRFTERQHKEFGKPPLPGVGLWTGLIEKTWVHGDDIKRGDIALSGQRMKEMAESKRTLQPDL